MNCCRCGKNFDYEKHNGICPKCAAYNRPQGQKPYDYDVDKDFSARYETVDDSHAKLHQMYDSAPAHQPQKQHAEYHRQYDNNYKHPNQPQMQNSAPNYRANQPQMQNSAPNYRANQPQGQNSMPNYRANQPQNRNSAPDYRANQPQMQNSAPNYRANQPQNRNSEPKYRMNQPQIQGGAPNYRANQTQGQMQNRGNAPQAKSTRNILVKIILIIFIINMVFSFIHAFYW